MYSKDAAAALHRRAILARMCQDASYDVFDAMSDASRAAERHITESLTGRDLPFIWAGGSLGRREFLPSSDIDLFLIYQRSETQAQIKPTIGGFVKFELGHLTLDLLRDLMTESLVDANRIIDGHALSASLSDPVPQAIQEASTVDRQLANIITEYYYWHYFDFPDKAKSRGSNYKYSSGASRTTIFFNLVYRLYTGNFPFDQLEGEPELVRSLQYIDCHLGILPPVRALDLILTVKNVAASLFHESDPRSRFASDLSLRAVYLKCRRRLTSAGMADFESFRRSYHAARRKVESAVAATVSCTLSQYFGANYCAELCSLDTQSLLDLCIDHITSSATSHPRALVSLIAWLFFATKNPSRSQAQILAERLTREPLSEVLGRSDGCHMFRGCR